VLAQPTRTAVYGPVRTVVWQGSAGDRRPYANLTGHSKAVPPWGNAQIPLVSEKKPAKWPA
jgi:hypothetical protein